MAWAKPLHKKVKIDWAGEFLISSEAEPHFDQNNSDEWFDWHYSRDKALEIVNNWRSAHSYPLQAMKMTLKQRAKTITSSFIVAQRLKRLASIRLKLKLSKEAGHHPNLSQMQDIGGCRAVLESVAQVRALEKKFSDASKKNPVRGPQFYKTSDYIQNPKDNGYRSVHLIYKYRSDLQLILAITVRG